jgi:hypothetical protein
MKNLVGFGVLALGIALLVFGYNESHSFNSDVSRFFSGNPTDRSMWFIISGIVAIVAGLVLTIRGKRSL